MKGHKVTIEIDFAEAYIKACEKYGCTSHVNYVTDQFKSQEGDTFYFLPLIGRKRNDKFTLLYPGEVPFEDAHMFKEDYEELIETTDSHNQ